MLGQLHLLDAQRRVDHVEDRGIAELEERVLLQSRRLLPGQLVVGRELVDRGLHLVAAGGDPLDLRVRVRLIPLQFREFQVRGVQRLLDSLHVAPRPWRGLRPVREVVFVRIARGVERGLQELGVLVGAVDLRVERLEMRVQLREGARVRLHLVAGLDEVCPQLVALLAVGLLPRRLDGLQRLVPIEPEECLLERLPVALVVRDDHPEEHRREEQPPRRRTRGSTSGCCSGDRSARPAASGAWRVSQLSVFSYRFVEAGLPSGTEN